MTQYQRIKDATEWQKQVNAFRMLNKAKSRSGAYEKEKLLRAMKRKAGSQYADLEPTNWRKRPLTLEEAIIDAQKGIDSSRKYTDRFTDVQDNLLNSLKMTEEELRQEAEFENKLKGRESKRLTEREMDEIAREADIYDVQTEGKELSAILKDLREKKKESFEKWAKDENKTWNDMQLSREIVKRQLREDPEHFTEARKLQRYKEENINEKYDKRKKELMKKSSGSFILGMAAAKLNKRKQVKALKSKRDEKRKEFNKENKKKGPGILSLFFGKKKMD